MDQAIDQHLRELEPLGKASSFADEVRSVLKEIELFEGCSDDECNVICEYMRCYGAPRNTHILEEDSAGDFLVIVLTGMVDVVKAYGPDDTRVVAHIGPGGILGEMSLVDGQRRFATCVSREPTDFAVLTRADLNEILVDHPRLANKLLLILLQLMTQRLREATLRMLPTLHGEAV